MTIITLTTDFGWRDNFVGVMKGVILSIHPKAIIVDLSHDLPPHDVASAAFSLFTAYSYFPDGTIHVAVVDPGVGTDRPMIGARTARHLFIAPDNGLLTYVLDACPPLQIRRIENRALCPGPLSATFHGRDLMAPAAAHLAEGASFELLGPLTDHVTRLAPLAAATGPDGIQGRVVYVDRFGNLITNIKTEDFRGKVPVITAGSILIRGLSSAYASVGPGVYAAVAGSSGFLEIACHMDRAERPPKLTIGTPVSVRWADALLPTGKPNNDPGLL